MTLEINWPKLKKTTIGYLAVLAAGSLSMQVDWVNKHVTPFLEKHPKLAPLSGGIIAGLTLLHSPAAETVIKQFSGFVKVVQPDGSTATAQIQGQEKTTAPVQEGDPVKTVTSIDMVKQSMPPAVEG